MKFSYNWLKELVEIKLSPQKLAEILTLRAFEVDSLKKIGNDWMLEVKIPANRITDAANHEGLAREISFVTNGKLKTEKEGPKKTTQVKTKSLVRIAIQKELSSRYTGQILEIKKIASSPKWMQERLITCGFRPIDAIVDVTNYVMLETGQPLHAFDFDKIHGGIMNIRESGKEETITTLDGIKHIVPEKSIIIEDKDRIIDLAGIMGGENSAVSNRTKKIFLQAADFDSKHIYRTGCALRFFSNASKIYSGGIDPAHTYDALERATTLLEQIIGAVRIESPVDIYRQKVVPAKILFRIAYANSLIGENLNDFYETIFEKIGCTVTKKGGNFIIGIPTKRHDLQREEDLIEEAARLFGYERIKPKLPSVSLAPVQENNELFWEEKIRTSLVSSGFSEAFVYEFMGKEELGKFFIDLRRAPELENPISPDTQYLTPQVLIQYAHAVSENTRREHAVRIFGIAKSFRNLNGVIDEHKDLIMVYAKRAESGEEEFYEMKGIIEELLETLGMDDYWFDDAIAVGEREQQYSIFHPYRVSEIKVGDKKIGTIGELHPVVLKNIKAKTRIAAVEIKLQYLIECAKKESEFRPIEKYPSMIRDIAVITPENVKTEDLLNIIENTGGPLLIDSDLFDYFQDDKMRREEEKSMAFHLIFQSEKHTLTDAEVDSIIKKITKSLEENGWEVKK